MRRIGVYGGSFNPIHAGHVGVALKAAAEHSLERVLVVPVKVSPFKTEGCADAVTFTDAQRWEMVKAACAGHPVLEPCDIELARGGISYTIDTLREIRKRYPDAKIYFIIGEDSVAGLPQWKDWDELQQLATFVSYPRTPESSTEIRRRIAAGEDIAGMVPPEIFHLLHPGSDVSSKNRMPHGAMP